MMKAVKDNKVYTINETSKKAYLAQGYDIEDEKGNIIATASTKTVPYVDYEKVLAENKKLKAEIAKLKKGNSE